jgi:hypothetical protein
MLQHRDLRKIESPVLQCIESGLGPRITHSDAKKAFACRTAFHTRDRCLYGLTTDIIRAMPLCMLYTALYGQHRAVESFYWLKRESCLQQGYIWTHWYQLTEKLCLYIREFVCLHRPSQCALVPIVTGGAGRSRLLRHQLRTS